jgi:hypothetical protein
MPLFRKTTSTSIPPSPEVIAPASSNAANQPAADDVSQHVPPTGRKRFFLVIEEEGDEEPVLASTPQSDASGQNEANIAAPSVPTPETPSTPPTDKHDDNPPPAETNASNDIPPVSITPLRIRRKLAWPENTSTDTPQDE